MEQTKIRAIDKLYELIPSCTKCHLGSKDLHALPRGNRDSRIMIIGEAVGQKEAELHSVFTGPAGILLDKIFASVGLDTNKDMYLTNILKCQPKTPPGSGKQNFTPTTIECNACLPYLLEEIRILQPRVVVLVGAVAIKSVLKLKASMKTAAGTWQTSIDYPGIDFFLMSHPAHLLYLERDPIAQEAAKLEMWKHIKSFKARLDTIL